MLKHTLKRQIQTLKVKHVLLWSFLIFLGLNHLNRVFNPEKCERQIVVEEKASNEHHDKQDVVNRLETPVHDRNMPLIFVGGMPRSGTTLMRALLDAHPDVRCGEETRIIPRVVFLRHELSMARKERERLEHAGMTDEIIDSAVSSFILEIMVKHGKPAPRLCNKDPFVLRFSTYMKKLFPKSKSILMIRDGRATVHSLMTRKVSISGFNLTDYRDCLIKWNNIVEQMYTQCNTAGTESCMPVYYEQLVLHPEATMKKVLEFLDLPWNKAVLEHDKLIDKEIALSKVEFSSDQVIKPINLDALSNWFGHIPADVLPDIDTLAPMLAKLGYDTVSDKVPNYGVADFNIKQNTIEIHNNKQYWDEKAKKYSNLV